MTRSPHLEPADVAAAVRTLLQDSARAGDRFGWRAFAPFDSAAVPDPGVDPWRWFEVVDVAYADEMVLVVFRWTDPATPELRYSHLAHADGLPSAEAVAQIAAGQLRRLLEPGWRDRVAKRWLSIEKVLIWLDPDGAEPTGRRATLRQDVHDAAWNAVRSAGP